MSGKNKALFIIVVDKNKLIEFDLYLKYTSPMKYLKSAILHSALR